MNKIAQIVDFASNLPKEISEKYNIVKIPFYITFDGEDYLVQGKDISDEEFYNKMAENPNKVPKTAAPNSEDWFKAFKEKYDKGFKEFIVTTISNELSASYQNAYIAKNDFTKKYEDSKITLIDTRTCTCGQAALEIKIAELIKKGVKSFEEISKIAKESVKKTTTIFSVKTLKYMKAGGRIGGATEFVGTLLNIKPISEFVDGVVKPIKAVRTRKKSLDKMVDIIVDRIKDPKKVILCTRSAMFEEDENYMVEKLREKLNYEGEIYSGMLGAVIGAHSGPGAIGIGFTELEE
ncbi:DegV family protein [Geotoga petraea]|jgi:DegV family protein with EDD domain|uniref:DegV family protein n=1 Tax=Geotoga petraea TaxID=28234 RepID=A0A1G6KVN8_9BACT|nr:DegV family protein [Geotoga petraea]TGG88748.1 DegV family protein [Geotoga petraea]SDC34831.1 EDD domain protein, DegV family [Geotoga petraea]